MDSHLSAFNTKTLSALFNHLQSMHVDSSPQEFDHFGSFFTTNCTTQLRSMRESVLQGRSAALADLREHLQYWHLDSHRIISQAASEDGNTVIFEMENKVSILGDIIDPFPETAVARFDSDGLIESLKVYSCQSPVVWLVQQKTGKGPYTEEELGEDNDEKYHVGRKEGGGCCGSRL